MTHVPTVSPTHVPTVSPTYVPTVSTVNDVQTNTPETTLVNIVILVVVVVWGIVVVLSCFKILPVHRSRF
jgi:hypothetical protein